MCAHSPYIDEANSFYSTNSVAQSEVEISGIAPIIAPIHKVNTKIGAPALRLRAQPYSKDFHYFSYDEILSLSVMCVELPLDYIKVRYLI